jgi:large subunit ribosomal protein L35
LKLKTKRGVAKRFRLTKAGKIKRKKAFLRHKLSSKPASRKMKLRKAGLVSYAEGKKIRKLMPYLG